ncbi:MAG TPA: hypothetical protein VFY26_20380 [Anaerolineales bacterium]|nr:hypothetical protein [Anaerolineales bacterium]
MKHVKSSFPFIVLLLGSLVLEGCSFSIEIMSPAATSPAVPSSTAAALIAASSTPTFTPPAPTEVLTLPTPTLISIRDGTFYQLEIFNSFGAGEYLRSLAFTADGAVLASTAGNTEDYAVYIWDVATGQNIGILGGHSDIVWDLAFSPDGRLLVSVSSDGTAIIRDWRNGDILKILNFPGEVISVRFSPDGQTLAVGGVDEPLNQIQNAAIWTFSVGSWEPQVQFSEYWNIGTLIYSPDGRTLVGGGTSRNLQVWQSDDPDPLFTLNHAHQVGKAVISPDGLTLAASTCGTVVNNACTLGEIWLWDLPTGRLLRKLPGLPNEIVSLAYTLDGTTLIVGARGGSLRFLSTADYGSRFETFSPDMIGAMALSPDNGLLATGGRNGQIHLWKVVYRP